MRRRVPRLSHLLGILFSSQCFGLSHPLRMGVRYPKVNDLKVTIDGRLAIS